MQQLDDVVGGVIFLVHLYELDTHVEKWAARRLCDILGNKDYKMVEDALSKLPDLCSNQIPVINMLKSDGRFDLSMQIKDIRELALEGKEELINFDIRNFYIRGLADKGIEALIHFNFIGSDSLDYRDFSARRFCFGKDEKNV